MAGAIVWVRLMHSSSHCLGHQVQIIPPAVAFQVTPANIDGLKDAVKVKMQLTIPASLLKVFAHNPATGGWVDQGH